MNHLSRDGDCCVWSSRFPGSGSGSVAWARLCLPSFFLPSSWLTGRIYRWFEDLQMKNGSGRDGGHRRKLRITMQNLCPSRENGLWQSWLPAGTTMRLSILLSLLIKHVLEIWRIPSLNSNWAIFSFCCLAYLLFWTLTVKTHTKAFSRALGLCMQFQQSDDLFIHFSNHSNRARCRKQQTLSVCVWFAGRDQQNRVREAVFPM